MDELIEVVKHLRAPDGCQWDKEQTHASLKPGIIEESVEVICGINVYEKTGDPDNLKEELGDLLLQVVMQSQIAEKEDLFSFEDVCKGISEKLIRRHPHVFGDLKMKNADEVLANWEEIKSKEKRIDVSGYIFDAFDEAQGLIDKARIRKKDKKR